MNFCPECGIDLRANPNVKFCFNCGNQIAAAKNVITYQSDSVVEKNNIHEDDFNYFDFPEKKYFRDFMSEVMEHVILNPNLSNNDIAVKYFEKGEDHFESRSIYFETISTLGNYEKLDAEFHKVNLIYQEQLYANQEYFIQNTFKMATMCYEASLYFEKNTEPYYQLYACYQYAKEYKKAHYYLILYTETSKELYGLKDNRTEKAAKLCRSNYLNNDQFDLEKLPDWIDKLGMPI